MDGTSANDSTPEQSHPKHTLALAFAHSVGQFRLEVDEAISLAGVTGVFGRSGSGKSTLLRIIAGLTQPNTGTVQCRGELWSNAENRHFVPTQRRSVGFMFQDTRLFGHLDVAGNLAYPIGRQRQRAQSMPEHVATIHLDEVVAALDLSPLLSRRPTSLSGGEKQRVALGRTLLTNPALLLLDEPLAALDLERKREIVPFLESALAQFNLPALYVSHDPEEVSRVADRLLVLENGRVTHHGPAASVFAALAPDGAMPLAEAGAAVTARVLRHDERLHATYLDFAGTELTVPLTHSAAIGSTKRIWLRARDIAIATERPQGLSIRNQLPCTIASLQPIHSTGTVDVTLHCADAQLHCQLTLAAVEELQLKPQLPVWALIKSVVLHT